MTITVLDNMEYGSDAAAQAAYKTSDTDNSICILMHFDGADNSTTFTDSSASPGTFQRYGSPVIKTDNYKFSGASAYFNGSSYISEVSSKNVNFGTIDFTIHFWMRSTVDWTSQPSSCGVVGKKLNDSSYGWQIYRDGGQASKLNFRGALQNNFFSNSTPQKDTWEHWAITRTSGTLRWFKNGVLDCTPATNNSNIADSPGGFFIGYSQTWGGYLKAYLDELIIIQGTSLWSSNFTPPVAPQSIYYGNLQDYSETSIIAESSYSLKAIAAQTTSLNKTLIRTISTPINLTGHAYIIGKIRSSRTGSNIKIGFHDSGGTTTEVTPNITAADTWQLIQFDISAVSDANKDAIDQIIITITNADADNTFYLDNFFAVTAADFALGMQVSKAVGYAVLYPVANAMNVSKVVAYAVLGPYVEPAEGGPMMWIF